jgi:hypothetical protein
LRVPRVASEAKQVGIERHCRERTEAREPNKRGRGAKRRGNSRARTAGRGKRAVTDSLTIKKSRVLQIRLTPDDYLVLERLADRSGEHISVYARALLRERLRPERVEMTNGIAAKMLQAFTESMERTTAQQVDLVNQLEKSGLAQAVVIASKGLEREQIEALGGAASPEPRPSNTGATESKLRHPGGKKAGKQGSANRGKVGSNPFNVVAATVTPRKGGKS